MNTIGYLSLFDTTTLVDGAPGTSLKAMGLVENTSTVHIKTYIIPTTGAKLNYDGISDSDVTTGKVTQEILCKSGGETLYAALAAKLGHYGVLTLTKSAGGTLVANAVLEQVRDITPFKTHGTAEMRIAVTFDLVGTWG